MGQIVGGFAVPHTPVFARLRDTPAFAPTARRYARVREQLVEARPDVIVMFTCDHLNAFFLDNLPTFCVGVADAMPGPCDPLEIPATRVPGVPELAAELHRRCLDAGFDVASSAEHGLDHSVMIPLAFLTPEMDIPLVPVFVNGLVPPLPRAARCHALGRVIGEAVREHPGGARLAVLASGAFSLETAGPRVDAGRLWGIPDRPWAVRVTDLLSTGAAAELVAAASAERLADAGNAAGELLAWLALLGALGDTPAAHIELEPGQGHAFAWWEGDLPQQRGAAPG